MSGECVSGENSISGIRLSVSDDSTECLQHDEEANYFAEEFENKVAVDDNDADRIQRFSHVDVVGGFERSVLSNGSSFPLMNTVNLNIPMEDLCPNVLKMLAGETEHFAIAERIKVLTTCISYGRKNALKVNGKDLIVAVGNSGSGKSTFLNYLAGCDMILKSPASLSLTGFQELVAVKSPAEGGRHRELFPVGHSNRSKTFIPQIERAYEDDYILCDCPGFFDSRGTDCKIIDAVNIKNIFQEAKSVKIIVIVSYHSIVGDRGRGLKDTVDNCRRIFGSKQIFEENLDSVMFCVTQAPLYADVESIINYVAPIISESNEKILNRIFFYHPLDKGNSCFFNRTKCVSAISAMKPIKTLEILYKSAIAAEEEKTLALVFDSLCKEMVDCMDRADYNGALKQWHSLRNILITDNEAAAQMLMKSKSMIEQKLLDKASNCREYIKTENFAAVAKLLDDVSSIQKIFAAEMANLNVPKFDDIHKEAFDILMERVETLSREIKIEQSRREDLESRIKGMDDADVALKKVLDKMFMKRVDSDDVRADINDLEKKLSSKIENLSESLRDFQTPAAVTETQRRNSHTFRLHRKGTDTQYPKFTDE